jgi:hypothetical protein
MTDYIPDFVYVGIDFFRDEMRTYIKQAFLMSPENGQKFLLERMEEGLKELEKADYYFGPNQPRGV